jgi:hypothetical protein
VETPILIPQEAPVLPYVLLTISKSKIGNHEKVAQQQYLSQGYHKTRSRASFFFKVPSKLFRNYSVSAFSL